MQWYDEWKVRRYLKKRLCVKCDAGTLSFVQRKKHHYNSDGLCTETGGSVYCAKLYMWMHKTEDGTLELNRWCTSHASNRASTALGGCGPKKPAWNTLSEKQIRIVSDVFKMCGLGPVIPLVMQKWSGLVPDDAQPDTVDIQFQVCGV